MSQIVFLTSVNCAGKGVQTALLEKEGYEILSVSALIKAEYPEYSGHIARGERVPDDVVIPLVERRVRGALLSGRKLVVDGFPRTLAQARFLANLIEEFQGHILLVHLVLPLVEAWRRAKHRREEALKKGLEVRPDDKPATVKERLGQYRKEVVPAVEYAESRVLRHCLRISALPAPSEVFKTLSEGLGLPQAA